VRAWYYGDEMTPTLLRGDEGATRLAQACASVRELISYLRSEVVRDASTWSRGATTDGVEWIRCDELLASPDRLEALIELSGAQQGPDDSVVAASLFVQNYSYRVLSLAIACLTTSGVVPDSNARSMAITMSRGRPSAVAYHDASVLVFADATTSADGNARRALAQGDLATRAFDYVVKGAIEEHLTLLVESTRQRLRVGERLLWGNIASSVAVSFRTMEGCQGEWIRELGEQFFRNAPEKLRGLGSFYALEHAQRRGWYWERTNCCLYDRLAGKIRCGDCSRTPVDERRAAYRASLEEPGPASN